MPKERCKTCKQKIVPPEPKTMEEAIEWVENNQPIVQLTPWMLKFFEWRSMMLDSEGRPTSNPKLCVSRKTQYRPKESMLKHKSRKQKRREREARERKQRDNA